MEKSLKPNLKLLRHSAVELLAIAVCTLFPKAQLISGEETTLGFYYDFFFPEPLLADQLSIIEERMRDLIRQDLPIKKMEMTKRSALELFKYHKQDLKTILLKGHAETLVSICQIGQFYDWAESPFVDTTKQIGVIKLLRSTLSSISLPGRSKVPVTRIEGIVFAEQKSLKQFLKRIEAAQTVDHRLLGQEMRLFTECQEESWPGCWMFLPKGTLLRRIFIDWWHREQQIHKYQEVFTPSLVKRKSPSQLSMSVDLAGFCYPLAATKAPFHALLFKSKQPSYQELPIRYSEYSEVYDPCKESQLWGLLRPRIFTLDQAFLFCTHDQVLTELISSLQFIDENFKILGFETQWHMIGKNPSSVGSARKWDESQDILKQAITRCGLSCAPENEESLSDEEGVSYGPRVELHFKDALGRSWKGPYLSIDVYHPEKFGLCYEAEEARLLPPLMIQRSIFGSIERLIAIMIEHYAGILPLWLTPEQVRIIPVGEKNAVFAREVKSDLEQAGFRASIEYSQESLGARVHAAEKEKVPFTLVVGDKEEKNKTFSLRKYAQQDVQESISLGSFLELLKEEIKNSEARSSILG